jgi:hypothetical protein
MTRAAALQPSCIPLASGLKYSQTLGNMASKAHFIFKPARMTQKGQNGRFHRVKSAIAA